MKLLQGSHAQNMHIGPQHANGRRAVGRAHWRLSHQQETKRTAPGLSHGRTVVCQCMPSESKEAGVQLGSDLKETLQQP